MVESKESMQSAIKNLQARTENIEKLLEKGNKTIVFQLGSHSIKFEFANEKIPQRVRTLIAYQLKKPIQNNLTKSDAKPEPIYQALNTFQEKLKQNGLIRPDNKQPKAGKPKAKVDIKMKIPEKPFKEVDPLFDDHAMWVVDDSRYIVRKPIRHGLFNLQDMALEDVINDLEYIFEHCVGRLKLTRKDYSSYNVVLVIPDIFPRPHIKALVNIFLSRMGFKAIYLHLESVLACFGTSVNSACVVDIGYQKTMICCVDEGVILPGTVIRKNFGSRHINEILLYQIQNRKLFGYNKKNYTVMINNEADMNQIDKLKEKACYIKDLQDYSNRIYEVYVIRQGKEQPMPINHSQSLSVAAHSMYSDMWNLLQKPNIRQCFDHHSKLFELFSDPDDYFEEISGGGDIFPASTESPHFNKDMFDPFLYLPLEDMICYSIANIKDADFRKRMANSILLIGGAGNYVGMIQNLEDRLIQRINLYDNTIERVQVIDLTARDVNPLNASWLGGTVIPKLDSLRDLWIERNRYTGDFSKEDNDEQEEAFFDKKFFSRKQRSQEWGIRYLKQKIPFLW